jgi:hypothetical protein
MKTQKTNKSGELVFAQPLPANDKYHVFYTKEARSLCGNYGLLVMDMSKTQPVNGNEVWKKGQDCKMCFRKANLKINP